LNRILLKTQTNIRKIQNKLPLILFILTVLFFLLSLYQRQPNEDEAVIAGHVYSFNKLGYVKAELYAGYGYGWDIRQYHYHKLFVLSGALLSSVFGFHIYTFKSVSLICTILFLVYFYLYIRDFEKQFNTKTFFFLASSLLLFNALFLEYSFMYRPEIMVVCLGFISFYYIMKGIRDSKLIWFILAGAFSGLSAFTHLNGLIFSVAGFVLLITRKKLIPLVLFSIFAGLFTLLYFYDIHSIEELKELYVQITHDPNVVEKSPLIISLLNEHMRFFWSPKEFIFSVLFFVALIFTFRDLRKTHSGLLIYMLTLVVSLGLLAHGKTAKYGLYYYPFMTVIIVFYWLNRKRYSKYLKYSMNILLLVYVGIHGYYNIKLFSERIDIAKHNEELAELIPEKNVKVSAPGTFAFDQIKNYTIRAEIAFDHHYNVFKPEEDKTVGKFFDFSKKLGDQYILIDKQTNTKKFILNHRFDTLDMNDTINDYELIAKKDNVYVFRLIE
jgi:hypothetical protein